METAAESEDTYLTLFAGAIRRRWPIVLGCVVVATAIALAISLGTSKEYSAKAEVLFQESHYAQELFGASSVPAPDPARLAATNLKLVDQGAVSQRVGRKLGLPPEEVREAISVTPQGEAELVSVTATWGEPDFAARLANTYVRQFIAISRAAEQAQLHRAQEAIEAQIDEMSQSEREGASGELLKSRADQLGVTARLQTGNAEIVSAAVPPSGPSAPKPARDTLLGLLLGLLVGVGLALLFDRLDKRLTDADAIGRALGARVLCSAPSASRRSARRSVENRTVDVYRAAYADLQFVQPNRDIRSVLIAPVDGEDGGSLVARQMALAAAADDVRVLIIDADLRNPSEGPGLTTVTGRSATIQEVVVHEDAPGGGSIDRLESGPRLGPPVDLLKADQMSDLLAQARQVYGFVVIDPPPLGSTPDGIPLARRADGLIMVARAKGHSDRSLRDLRAKLDRVGVNVVGVIVTGLAPSQEHYEPVARSEQGV